VVLNTTLIIPFIIAPMVNALTTWGAMKAGWVPLTTGSLATWTMPPIISGFLVTSSVMGSVLQAVNIVIDVLIYLPFLLNLNK
jgi:PTS system cellobiose-specific IIC component